MGIANAAGMRRSLLLLLRLLLLRLLLLPLLLLLRLSILLLSLTAFCLLESADSVIGDQAPRK